MATMTDVDIMMARIRGRLRDESEEGQGDTQEAGEEDHQEEGQESLEKKAADNDEP